MDEQSQDRLAVLSGVAFLNAQFGGLAGNDRVDESSLYHLFETFRIGVKCHGSSVHLDGKQAVLVVPRLLVERLILESDQGFELTKEGVQELARLQEMIIDLE